MLACLRHLAARRGVRRHRCRRTQMARRGHADTATEIALAEGVVVDIAGVVPAPDQPRQSGTRRLVRPACAWAHPVGQMDIGIARQHGRSPECTPVLQLVVLPWQCAAACPTPMLIARLVRIEAAAFATADHHSRFLLSVQECSYYVLSIGGRALMKLFTTCCVKGTSAGDAQASCWQNFWWD